MEETELPVGIEGGSEEAGTPGPVIGTLQESDLHRGLKAYYEPDETRWEQPLGRFVADISDGGRAVEIQTGNFSALREKLAYYREAGITVRVVYPVRVKKQLIWQNEQGEFLRVSAGRREKPIRFLEELYAVCGWFDFSFCSFDLAYVAVTEHRVSYPSRAYGKRKRLNTVLDGVEKIDHFAAPWDFLRLLPEELPQPFTRADLRKTAKIHERTAAYACLALEKLGVLRRAGKRGRAFLYERVDSTEPA